MTQIHEKTYDLTIFKHPGEIIPIGSTKITGKRNIDLLILFGLFIVNLKWFLTTESILSLYTTPFFHFLFVVNFWHDAYLG